MNSDADIRLYNCGHNLHSKCLSERSQFLFDTNESKTQFLTKGLVNFNNDLCPLCVEKQIKQETELLVRKKATITKTLSTEKNPFL